MEYEEFNVGLLIEQRMNELGMTKAELARKIGIPNQNVNRLLEKKNMDTARLASIGEALDYDFFAHFKPKPDAADGAASTSIEAQNSAVSVGANSNAINNIGTSEADKEQIKLLRQLLEEKERTIQLLLHRKD